MRPLAGNWTARALDALAGAILRRPRWFFWPQMALFALCVGYTVRFLQFDVSRDHLVGANKKYHQNFLAFREEFPEQDDLVVVVESEDTEKNRQFVERLGAKLEAETNLFKDVFYKGDLKLMGNKALLFVPDETALTLSAGDFKDLPAFAAKLRAPSDPVSAYLRGRLSDATLRALATVPDAAADPAALLTPLTNDLNAVIAGEGIFEPVRFGGVPLRAETRALLARAAAGEERARLNRLLLGDAYPRELARSDLEELLDMLQTYRPFIEKFSRATNLVSLFGLINTQFRTASREANAETDALLRALPALERIVAQGEASLIRPGLPPSPGINALFGAGPEAEQAMYITFAQGRLFLVTTHAPHPDANHPAVDRLRQLVEDTRAEVPGVNVGLTGEPVLERDEMLQSQQDTTLASVIALALCAIIFIYGYQETGRPLKAVFCLLIGIGYTMGFATLVIGHLNILTITFVPILIGLAIDFGVHLTTRYEEELRHGQSEAEALRRALVFTGQGIFTGAFTTAGAFLAMGLTDFRGIQEMGIICGGGLLVCLAPMLTVLPTLLLRGQQNVLDHAPPGKPDPRARLEQLWLRRPGLVAVLTLGACVAAAVQFHRVYFDYNLLNMQSAGLPAVVFERKLIESASQSVLFGAVIADSLAEANAIEAKVKTLPAVSEVQSLSSYLTADPTRKLALIREIKQAVAPIQFAPMDRAPVPVAALSSTLWSLAGFCGAAATEAEKEDPALARQLLSLQERINLFRRRMLAESAGHAEARLAAYQQALFRDLHETFDALRTQDDQGPMRVEDLPDALRNRFVGRTGKHLLQVYPKEDVWQRENQREFIRQLREALDPGNTNHPIITGTPVQLYEYTGLLRQSYEQAARYALAAISLLVLLHFRSFVSLLLALVPVAVGFIWLCGFMGWRDLPFNPANIMTLPLVIGIGVTNGIHILNRFAEERSPGLLAKSTGKAVLVSGLTTVAGFGSLTLAQHQGIESLGWVMSIGVATCMIAGLTFLPALLTLLLGAGWKGGMDATASVKREGVKSET